MSMPPFPRPDRTPEQNAQRLDDYCRWQSRMALYSAIIASLALVTAFVLLICWRSNAT